MSSTLSESMLQINTNAMAPTSNNSHESHPTDDSSNESISDLKFYECQTMSSIPVKQELVLNNDKKRKTCDNAYEYEEPLKKRQMHGVLPMLKKRMNLCKFYTEMATRYNEDAIKQMIIAGDASKKAKIMAKTAKGINTLIINFVVLNNKTGQMHGVLPVLNVPVLKKRINLCKLYTEMAKCHKEKAIKQMIIARDASEKAKILAKKTQDMTQLAKTMQDIISIVALP